jgi:hypothetical protein
VTEESTHAQSNDPRVVAAAREYFDLLDRGLSVDREDFIARNPEIAVRVQSAIVEEDERRRLQAAQSPPARDLTGGSTGAFTRHGDTLPPPGRTDSGPAAARCRQALNSAGTASCASWAAGRWGPSTWRSTRSSTGRSR